MPFVLCVLGVSVVHLGALRWRLLVAFALVLAGSAVPVVARPVRASSSVSLEAHYALDLTVDDQKATVTTRERVDATNRTGSTLASLVFNLTPLHARAIKDLTATVEVDGSPRPVTPRVDDVVVEVPLTSPLPPGQTDTVDFAFVVVLPKPGTLRLGDADGVLALGNWFPILAVYGPQGWDRHHYSPVGDPFYTETADYAVQVHADPRLVIAHTGTLVSRAGGDWTIRADDVRDFALIMSRAYQTRDAQVDGTHLSVYYLPGDASGGLATLRYATEAFGWYADHLGPYGYPSFAIAEAPSQSPDDVGQEYPNLIFVAAPYVHLPTPPGYYLTYLVAHETGHQWLYGLVGNDHVHQPWLDEGPVVQLSYLFLRDRYPAAYRQQWAQLVAGYHQAVATWGARPLDTTEADYTSDTQYYDLLYRGSAIFLEELRQGMSDDTYFAFLRRYVAAYRGGNATTQDFLLLAEQTSHRDLSALYRQYFRPASYAPVSPTPPATATIAPPTATLSPAPTAAPTTAAVPAPTAPPPTVRAVPAFAGAVAAPSPTALPASPMPSPPATPGTRPILLAFLIALGVFAVVLRIVVGRR